MAALRFDPLVPAAVQIQAAGGPTFTGSATLAVAAAAVSASVAGWVGSASLSASAAQVGGADLGAHGTTALLMRAYQKRRRHAYTRM